MSAKGSDATETTHTLIDDVARLVEEHFFRAVADQLRDCKRGIPNVPVSPSETRTPADLATALRAACKDIPPEFSKLVDEHFWELLGVTPVSARRCKWTLDTDGIYQTGCGNHFCYSDGTRTECTAKFCQACGEEITGDK